jgi:hypothetical protein
LQRGMRESMTGFERDMMKSNQELSKPAV